MIKRILIIAALVGFAIMIAPLITDVEPLDELGMVAERYVQGAIDELGAQNIVTAVVVTYRGLDTLGEVTVLFIATAGVGYLLRKRKKEAVEKEIREQSEILHIAGRFLLPLIILFGVYVFTHGHLTPGGGFQGGVILASGVLLLLLSNTMFKMKHQVMNALESLSGVTYVIIGVLGLVLTAGFLDSRILPIGEVGMLFSAGTIPIIYSLIGLKVGTELAGILGHLGERS